MFRGSIVALITPFRDGEVDEKAFCDLIEWQISEGTNGLVPCGTTGESPTISHAEHMRLITLCVQQAAGRVPVIAGTGSNSTAEAIGLAKHAAEAGADAQLVVTPYYNKPTQEGLYRHYMAIVEAVDLPLILYNVPSRTSIDLSVDTVARLAGHPRIVGIKDATNDLTRPLRTRRELGPDFAILSGEDATVLALMGQGGDGCISVTANIAPADCARMHAAWRAGDFATALEINERLLPVHDALFCETSPGPVKYAASLMGLCAPDLRLPLCEIADSSKAQVEAAIRGAGLLPDSAAAARA